MRESPCLPDATRAEAGRAWIGPRSTAAARRTVSCGELRRILNRDLQRAAGTRDVVFRGPIIPRHRPGSDGCNWSSHALMAPGDFVAEARRVIARARAFYNMAG